MTRRELLQLGLALPFASQPRRPEEPWRSFTISTSVNLRSFGPARVWLPIPTDRAPYQRIRDLKWWASDAPAELSSDVPILTVTFPKEVVSQWIQVTFTVQTRDWSVDLNVPSAPSPAKVDKKYLQPTTLIPIDGIVRDTALKITAGHESELSKARAIYDWIVDNTLRDPAVKGCGLGDIRWMLETKTFAGKCADLNGLFVGLARSVALPARDVYGLRVAPSTRYASLGKTGDVSSSQHCRAEVFVQPFGWIPVDPADVAKIRLEEKANGPLTDPYLEQARARMFGSWEMNWFGYNEAHDVLLPGALSKPLPFFMYPRALINGRELKDGLDPATFYYSITAKEV